MRIYQYYNTGDNGDYDGYTANWLAQTFTPQAAHMISKIKLKLFRVGDPGTITVSIKNTTSGKPSGADLCKGTIEGTDLTLDTNGEWYEITLGDGYELSKGVQYAIVVRAPSGDASNKVSWRTDLTSPVYTGGTYCSSTDSGVDWGIISGSDCMFEEWGTGPPSPTTVTWGNLLKSQISTEKIEEAVARLIQSHEDDANAHVEVGESLYSHKASEIIDHIASSIINDKINAGEITPPKLKVTSKVADCVVATANGDYTSIQNALDAGKKRIYVKAGTYEISSSQIILSSGVDIWGESNGSVILRLADGANCDVIRVGDGLTALTDITIRDIQIDGNKANQTNNFISGIYFKGGSGTKITRSNILDCYIYGCRKAGIRFYYSDNNMINRNKVILNNKGIDLYYSSDNLVIENQANSNIDFTGIGVGYGNNNTLIGNQANSNTGDGINISNGNNNVVIGNHLSLNITHGIYVQWADNNIVVENQANSNTQDGIRIKNGENNLINGNQVNSNSGNGIQLYTLGNPPNSEYNMISGNRTTGNSGHGIKILANCIDNFIIQNYCTGNITGAISDVGTGTIIRDNIGYNPVGASSITVTASPFTHTAGASPETIYVRAGTVSNISKGGTTLFIDTGHSVDLEPGKSMVVTYTVIPTMIKDIH